MGDGEATQHRVRLLVAGRVQGVGYRFFIEREAERLGLAGWVRNLSDGRVELEACGRKEVLGDLIRAAHRGPPLARVTSVLEDWGEAGSPGSGFRVRHDEAP